MKTEIIFCFHFNLALTYIQVTTYIQIFVLIVTAQFGNSQNFLGKFVRYFVTLRCFYTVVIHRK